MRLHIRVQRKQSGNTLLSLYPHAESNRNRQNRNLKFYPLNYRAGQISANIVIFEHLTTYSTKFPQCGETFADFPQDLIPSSGFKKHIMKKAYIFPGQGSQFPGMAKDLYESHAEARTMLERANEILGFRITDIMFDGTSDDLKQTKVTQPAIFLHSVLLAKCLPDFAPDMVAGHSLGEFSALVAAGAMDFEEGLRLVSIRAQAMQKACELTPGSMAAVIALPTEKVEEICRETEGVVVAANYNCDGQIVISGEKEAVEAACVKMKEAGAKRALPLPVGGAFHSPLMEPARAELAEGIEKAIFKAPICPVYQNVTARPSTDPDEIKANLLTQLTSPVRWTQSIRNMIEDGAGYFTELGPGKVLQGLVAKIAAASVDIDGYQSL